MQKNTKFKQTEIGMIPEDWKIATSEEVMGVITDFVANGSFASLAENVKYYEEPKEAILIRLVDYNNHFSGNFIYIDEKGYNYLKKSKLFGGEIIISNVGAYAGTVFRTPKLNKKMTLGPNSIMMRSKTSNDFYFYWFLSPAGQTSIKTILTGSANPKFNKTDFRKLKVPVPSIQEQQAIAKILLDLDSKIELNQSMNKTLEAIGQAIFKHWFVDFEFPNEQGKPYKSSGGEMIDSELGKIPKGWKVGKLGDFIFVERGLSYKGSGLCENGIPMINLGNIAPNNHFRYDGLKFYSGDFKERNLVKPGDLIIANTDITQKREVLGSCLIVPSDLGNNTVLFTHHIYAIRFLNDKETLPKHFLSYLLQTPEYRERATGFATGTTVLALPEDAILNFNFVIPNNELLDKFDRLMTYIKEKSSGNIVTSKNLSQIRDSLLPKLMSGKIRVPVEAK